MEHLILLVLCWILVAKISKNPEDGVDIGTLSFDGLFGLFLVGGMLWGALEGVYWVFFG